MKAQSLRAFLEFDSSVLALFPQSFGNGDELGLCRASLRF